MNKDKKTYVEPNMKVVEVEATEIMAGSQTCSTLYNPSRGCTQPTDEDWEGAKGNPSGFEEE